MFTPQLYCDTGKFVAKIMMDLHQEYNNIWKKIYIKRH
jgi:hypothetical protein